MYAYSNIQWLFFFYFYCFVGWCFESSYVSACKRKLINRGFMRGPFLPLYGSGAIMMLVVSMPVRDNLFLVYIAGCFGATALEYITGVIMEALFKVRYWDYSNKKFNFQGHICLGSTAAWGFLTILMTEVVHKPIERFALGIPENVLSLLTIVLTIIIVTDFTLSFKTALDLRDVLVRMEKGKEDMLHMMKRLDVILAVLDDVKDAKIQRLEYRADEVTQGIEDRLEKLKSRYKERQNDKISSFLDEIMDIRSRYTIHKAERVRFKSVRNFYKRNLILGNPTMTSVRFKEMLDELKSAALEHRKKDKK